MRQTEAQAREIAARGDEVLLLFYYSGHAGADGLHLQGSVVSWNEIRRWLQGSSARVKLAFVDACESGSLARDRGGSPVDTVQIEVDDALTMAGLAIVTSTGPLSVAREGATFGGGVFTRSLLTGLRGAADGDSDGRITLDEAYRFAFAETVVSTAGSSASVQRPEVRYDLEGVGDLVLTRIPDRAAGLVLPEELEGTYSVVSVASGQVVARIDKKAGEAQRLALPAGRYVVRKVRQLDVLLAELDLVWGGDRWIEDGSMSAVPLGDPLARGGWNPRPLRATLRALIASPSVNGQPVTVGGGGELRIALNRSLAAVAQGGHHRGRRIEWSGRLGVEVTRFGAGLLAERRSRRLDLSVGGGLQMALLSQRVDYIDIDGPFRQEVLRADQWAPGAFAQGGLHLPVGPTVGLDLGVASHVHLANVDEQNQLLIEGMIQGGLSLRFRTRPLARAKR